jgi:hypothetical protein
MTRRAAHFLVPILAADRGTMSLVNARTGIVLVSRVELAADSESRRRGLLGRDRMPEDEGLVIAPCSAIHTWFMRFAIDVVFAARDGRVLKTYARLGPWRIASAWRAFAVVELAAGTLERRPVRPGDQLSLTEFRPGGDLT